MNALKTEDPETWSELMSGGFVVAYAPVPLTILTSSDAHLIPKMRKFQRSDEFR